MPWGQKCKKMPISQESWWGEKKKQGRHLPQRWRTIKLLKGTHCMFELFRFLPPISIDWLSCRYRNSILYLFLSNIPYFGINCSRYYLKLVVGLAKDECWNIGFWSRFDECIILFLMRVILTLNGSSGFIENDCAFLQH
jgi:hypothetical protein